VLLPGRRSRGSRNFSSELVDRHYFLSAVACLARLISLQRKLFRVPPLPFVLFSWV